jgi:hypothetical protein
VAAGAAALSAVVASAAVVVDLPAAQGVLMAAAVLLQVGNPNHFKIKKGPVGGLRPFKRAFF